MAPAELLTEANRVLCENNITKTRLSFFLARLNINTGVLRFINAGTPQALHGTAGSGFEMMPMRSGTVLGAHNKSIYRECIVSLQPGDRIFLYSQGVLKATNAEKVPFGAARLQDSLQNTADSVTDLIRTVQVDLRRFTGNKEQATDCTMLAVEFKGKWMQQKSFDFTGGRTAPPAAMLSDINIMLEAVLASPVAMAELEKSITDILGALSAEDSIHLNFCCNEETAEVQISYGTPQFNPMEHLPALAVDDYRYSTDPSTGSTINLTKSLA